MQGRQWVMKAVKESMSRPATPPQNSDNSTTNWNTSDRPWALSRMHPNLTKR